MSRLVNSTSVSFCKFPGNIFKCELVEVGQESRKLKLTLISVIAIWTTIAHLNVSFGTILQFRTAFLVRRDDQIGSGVDAFIHGAFVGTLPYVAGFEFLFADRAKRRITFAAALACKCFVNLIGGA